MTPLPLKEVQLVIYEILRSERFRPFQDFKNCSQNFIIYGWAHNATLELFSQDINHGRLRGLVVKQSTKKEERKKFGAGMKIPFRIGAKVGYVTRSTMTKILLHRTILLRFLNASLT